MRLACRGGKFSVRCMNKRSLARMVFAVVLGCLSLLPNLSKASSLTYNTATNLGWSTANAWNGPATWTSGDSATIASGVTIAYSANTSIANLTVGGSGTAVIINSTGSNTLTFSGGTLTVTNPNGFQTNGSASIQGNFTLTGAPTGFVRLSTSGVPIAYSGTATLENARFEWSAANQVGTNSHFVVNGGVLQNRDNGTSSIGSVTLNGGTFELGRVNSSVNNSTTIVTRLSGTGGTITTPLLNTGSNTTLLRTLTVNQSENTTFAGTIAGVNNGTNSSRIALNKQGAGSLTLSGSVNLARQTNVTGGSLYIGGTNATFTDELVAGGTAINVNGATLGGIGTLVISGGDNVVLTSTGRLAAGEEGTIGRTTYSFTGIGGGLNLSAATASAATGWLAFDLGADDTAGTTFDQISITQGYFNIGTGLNFSDFAFTTQAGFAAGTYTLFTTDTGITGSLGTVTGIIGGLNSTIAISGNDLILTVVPEPQAISLILGAAALVFLLRRRSRRAS